MIVRNVGQSPTQLCADGTVTSEKLVKQLKVCGARKDLIRGKLLHVDAIQSGLERNMYVASTLVLMYGQCGSMDQAREIFDKMERRDVVTWNVLILGYVNNGHSSEALEIFNKMSSAPNAVTFVAALKACTRLGNLERGMAIHEESKRLGLDKDVVVASTLVNMFRRIGSIEQAHNVFRTIGSPNAVSWTSLMLGYMEKGEHRIALELFYEMDSEPDRVTLVTALKACIGMGTSSCLKEGLLVHKRAVELGLDKDVFVASALVDMYCKLGKMIQAKEVFQGMQNRDTVTWNMLILGYLEAGQSLEALRAFESMDCPPSSVTFVAALKVCARLASGGEVSPYVCLEKGERIHRDAERLGFDTDVQVANTLIDMYSKCGEMSAARHVFNRMPNQNVVSWTALILGYVDNGQQAAGLDVFSRIDCTPSSVVLSAALKACAGLAIETKSHLRTALAVHHQVIRLGCEEDIVVSSTLVDMYSKLGEIHRAQAVFDAMLHKSPVSWTALILGYLENGAFPTALEIFHRMNCAADRITFVAALKACAGLSNKADSRRYGEAVYQQAKELGLDKDVLVGSAMLNLYTKSGDMILARRVFEGMVIRDVVSCSALMFGYVENGMSSVALEVFNSMECAPNRTVFLAALKACGTLGALAIGQEIHSEICKLGLERDEMVVNSLVDFYGKCSRMVAAEQAFNSSEGYPGGTVLWNALIGGYSSLGDASHVLRLVEAMMTRGVQPDGVTLQMTLAACSHAGFVTDGVKQFERLVKCGVKATMEHYGCLVDMLGRANKLEEAYQLVKRMPFQANSFIWSTLMSSCKKWNNVELAKVAFTSLVHLDEDEQAIASAYTSLQNMLEQSSLDTKRRAETNLD